jgi:hypothetical protein
MQSLTPASADDLPPLGELIADDPFPFQSGTYGEGGTPAEQPRNGDQPGEIPSVIGNAAGGTASPLPREGSVAYFGMVTGLVFSWLGGCACGGAGRMLVRTSGVRAVWCGC